MKGRQRILAAKGRGFTLPELLVVMSIIGTLSTLGVVSFSSARASARDAKRLSDMKQVQTAVELFYENNNHYPGDGRSGDEGRILGESAGGGMMLSDGGWGSVQRGTLYMILVPKNPPPGGSPYIYRALNRDGTNCDLNACDSYAILFATEKDTGAYKAGPHAMTPSGIAGAEGGYAGAGVTGAGGKIVGIEGVQARLAEAANTATISVSNFVENKQVQQVTEVAVAPTVAVAAVANTVLSTASGATYIFYFFTQPFLLLGRRKRKAWGTVYNALSRLGEDLVIVRLRDAQSGRIVKSTVTDMEGRFSFLAQAGRYRIEVAKNGFTFPSMITGGKKEDGPFLDIYHGEPIEVGAGGAVLTPNVPIDPVDQEASDAAVTKRHFLRKLQKGVALASPVLGGLTFLIKPSVFVGLLFAFQVVSYMLFRRLAQAPEPKGWGIVFDQATKRPVPNAILRIFEAKYNKLLETQVADRHGRYHFRVGGNVYYLTVTKPGYLKTETDPVDLSAVKEPTVIASDLPVLAAPKSGTLVPPPGSTPPPNTKMGGGFGNAPEKPKASVLPPPPKPAAPPGAAAVPAAKPVAPGMSYEQRMLARMKSAAPGTATPAAPPAAPAAAPAPKPSAPPAPPAATPAAPAKPAPASLGLDDAQAEIAALVAEAGPVPATPPPPSDAAPPAAPPAPPPAPSAPPPAPPAAPPAPPAKPAPPAPPPAPPKADRGPKDWLNSI